MGSVVSIILIYTDGHGYCSKYNSPWYYWLVILYNSTVIYNVATSLQGPPGATGSLGAQGERGERVSTSKQVLCCQVITTFVFHTITYLSKYIYLLSFIPIQCRNNMV